MKYVRLITFLFTGFSFMFLFQSCSTCSSPKRVENIVVDVDMANLTMDSIYLSMGHRVLYDLPTPIEVSMLIKNWGVPYPELLNDPANASAYLTRKKQALNLGVYITDMSTAGLYEQTQTVLRYRHALQTLIEALGLQTVVSKDVIQEIEDNINDKNRLLEILSDIYASAAKYLSNDDRDFYALAIMTGSWVEGMYIAVSMIDENQPSNEGKMKQVLNENKATFDILWKALGELDIIPEEAIFLMLEMSPIAHLLGHETLGAATTARKDPLNNIDNITPKFFADVKEHILLLRNHFVKR